MAIANAIFDGCCKHLRWKLQMPSSTDVANIFDGNCKCLLRWMLQTSSMAIANAFFDGCCKHLRWKLQMPSSTDVANIFDGNCKCLLQRMLQTSSMAIENAFFNGCCKHLRWQLKMPSSMDVANIFDGNGNCLQWMLETIHFNKKEQQITQKKFPNRNTRNRSLVINDLPTRTRAAFSTNGTCIYDNTIATTGNLGNMFQYKYDVLSLFHNCLSRYDYSLVRCCLAILHSAPP